MPTRDAIRWFKSHFESKIDAAVAGTPFSKDLITAIACQETGYLWNTLRRHMPVERVLELCVGDTIDFKPPNKGRKAFPKNKDALLAHPRGREMFLIARQALVDMAQYISEYRGAADNPVKFCRGFGIFQFDLQHLDQDPDYFLSQGWANFDVCLAHCVEELKSAQDRARLGYKNRLTDLEQCHVAIAYNRGSFNPAMGLRQGHRSSDGRYYGENIEQYLKLSQNTPASATADPTPPPTPPGATVLPDPTPVDATAKTYRVEVETLPLRMRSTPEIPTRNPAGNVIARLPDGQLVRAVTGTKKDQFLEVETSLRGAFYRGWVSARYLVEVPGTENIEIETSAPSGTQPTIPAVYTPRRSHSVTCRRDRANAHSLNEAGQPERHGTTPAELCNDLHTIISWLDVENPAHARYQRTPSATFCNIYAHDYCHLAGVYLPRVWWTPSAIIRITQGQAVEPQINATIVEQRANALFEWLRDFGLDFGWRQTGTLTKLQEAANQGAVCLIVARRHSDGPPGHITVVAPETLDHSGRRNAAGEIIAPLQSQAGSRNFRLSASTANWWRNDQFAESAFWIHA